MESVIRGRFSNRVPHCRRAAAANLPLQKQSKTAAPRACLGAIFNPNRKKRGREGSWEVKQGRLRVSQEKDGVFRKLTRVVYKSRLTPFPPLKSHFLLHKKHSEY